MTGQVQFDSYEDAGAVIAVELVNALTLERAYGRPAPRAEAFAAVQRALDVDPPFAPLHERDVPEVVALAGRLRAILDDLHDGDLDAAAGRLNDLLAAHPAHPHLAKDHGRWRMHHHPVDAAVVPMVTAVCAEAVARMVGNDAGDRLGTCGSDGCDRVFLDVSKNASRRFCSTTCQNRVKAAAFRRRRSVDEV